MVRSIVLPFCNVWLNLITILSSFFKTSKDVTIILSEKAMTLCTSISATSRMISFISWYAVILSSSIQSSRVLELRFRLYFKNHITNRKRVDFRVMWNTSWKFKSLYFRARKVFSLHVNIDTVLLMQNDIKV